MKIKSRKIFAVLAITMMLLTLLPATALAALPAAITTPGTLIMAQGTGPTALTVAPVITEAVVGDITAATDIVLTAPAGIQFDPAAAPTATIGGAGAGFVAIAGQVFTSVNPNDTLRFDVIVPSTTIGPITLGGIRVIAAAGATVGANNITSNVTAGNLIVVTVTAHPVAITTPGALTVVVGTAATLLTTAPVITEGAPGAITAAANIVLTAPAGLQFDPAAPAPTVTGPAGFVSLSGAVSTVGANPNNTLTFDVLTPSTAAGPITLVGIRVVAPTVAGTFNITSNVTLGNLIVVTASAPLVAITTPGALTVTVGTGVTALTVAPVVTEGAVGAITAAANIVLTAPAGLQFDTAAPAPTVTGPAGFVSLPGAVTTVGANPSNTLTFDVLTPSTAVGPITLAGIRVVAPTVAGTYNVTSNLGAGNIIVVTATVVPVVAAYSPTTTIFEADRTSHPVNQNIRFTLTMRDAAGTLLTSRTVAPIILQSNMDTLTGAFIAPATGAIAGTALARRVATPAEEGTAFLGLMTNAAGQIEFNLTSAVAGTTTVNAYNSVLTGERRLIGSATVTFTAGAATAVSISRRDTIGVTVAVDREVEFRAAVLAGTSPASGITVTFEEQEGGGAWRTIGTAVSNANGFADFKFTRLTSSAGAVLNYRATITGAVSATTPITWVAGGALSMTAPANANVARNQALNVDVWVDDAHGNRRGAQNVEFRLTRPVGSGATFTASGTDEATIATDNVAGTNFGRARATFTPDVLGEYRVRATIPGTGISTTTVYTAVDMGSVTRMEITLPPDRIALRSVPTGTLAAGVPQEVMTLDLAGRIRLFDAAGVSRTAAAGEVTLSSSNPTVVSVSGYMLSLAFRTAARGLVTITGVHAPSGQTATVRVPVIGVPVGILETVTVDGLNASVALQMVDVDVNPAFAVPRVSFIVNAPAGVTVGATTAFAAGTGRGSVALTAAAPGEYSVTVVTVPPGPYTAISRTFTVEFAAPPAPVVGAQSVTMFIGARGFTQDGAGKTMDVAPFIENQRTFVPVRFLAEAFGATADWVPKDAPVRTVTLTRADRTITINIGSPAITVVKDGVTSTVTADVAAFIRNGRTVLPFRAIAEAFGAEVDYGPKDAPIEWVSFKQ